MEPRQLLVPLLAGAAAVVLGAAGFWSSRKNKKNPFDRSAQLLLEGKDQVSEDPGPVVSFSEQGMTLPTEGGGAEFVPYSSFESVIETPDILLFVYGQRVTVLQKQDLIQGDGQEFSRLISEAVPRYELLGLS